LRPVEATMSDVEEIERRLAATESILQGMFCTVTADLIMFQAAIAALREEGVLTEKMVDRMAIDAQIRLQQYDRPMLDPLVVSEIASQLDNLAERLRIAAPSVPLVASAENGKGAGTGSRLSLR